MNTYLPNVNSFVPPTYAGEFDDILDSSSSKSLSDPSEEIRLVYNNVRSSPALESNGSMPKEKNKELLDLENLTLQTPSKATLVRDLSLVINEKDHLLVSDFFDVNFFVFHYLGKVVGAEDIYWYVFVPTGNGT